MKIPTTRTQCDRFVAGQPREIRRWFDSYFRQLSRRHRGNYIPEPSWLRLPYWRVLPSMLLARYRERSHRARLPRVFLRDVQWGQYCLYLFIRFQDDLYDGQSDSLVSIYVSDQCLFEADRVFRKYFPDESWFWKKYRESLRLTTQSIVEVDGLQQKSDSHPKDLLNGYVRMSSILKVGSAAVCAKLDMKQVYRRVSSFCDEMAKIGQIIDDLYDVEEDLRHQRFNYLGNALERSKNRMLASGRADEVLDRLRELATTEKICSEIRAHFDTASSAIDPLAIREMKTYLAHLASRLPQMT